MAFPTDHTQHDGTLLLLLPGTAELILSDYQTTGPHELSMTLSNRLGFETITLDLMVDYDISGAEFFYNLAEIPGANLTDGNGTILMSPSSSSLAAIPHISYEFGFIVSSASRTLFKMDYGDGNAVEEYFPDDMV